MQFTLIQHAKTKIDPQTSILLWGLDQDGLNKADILAGSEAIKQLEIIYSSDQTKAIETMLYLAKPNTLPMRVHKDLTEITSFTSKFYTDLEEYEHNLANYYAGKIDRLNDGETITEALSRFESALETIASSHNEAVNIGIVTHGHLMSFFTDKYSELSALDLHHSIGLPDVAVFDWKTKKFKQLWGSKYR